MSGGGGAADVCGLAGRLREKLAGHGRNWFLDDRRRVIGMARIPSDRPSARPARLAFAEILAEGDSYRLVRTSIEPLPGDVTLAEAALMRVEREGWQGMDIAVCLPDENVRIYEMELPPHMEENEWREAAHWELDARLMEEGIDADACAMAYCRRSASAVLLAAAEQRYLESLRDAFKEQGLFLRGTAVCVHGGSVEETASVVLGMELLPQTREFLPAIAAAMSVLDADPSIGLRLQGEPIPHQRVRYRRLAVLVCAMTFLVLFAAAFFDARAFFEARRDCEREEQALALLQRDEKTMRMTARLQEEIQQRDAKAAQLMEAAMPWYSVMVHLGRPELQTEGVWLRSIAMRPDKKIEVRGAALSYGALSSFLKSFETDRDFFSQGPVLEESAETTEGEQTGIAFRISLGI